jgi:hypothetical protein
MCDIREKQLVVHYEENIWEDVVVCRHHNFLLWLTTFV